ncbi:YeaC family protein [Flavobacterium sp. W21_SRS_FM6]|uniref:YeaC family protein n=1 Tax=Flavobacterium sp. W21_SRS_FM6 TaxID=3240268 RepID=UPI003F8DEBAA
MNVEVLVQNMSQDIYEKLRGSVETGKWLDGSPLTEQQKETCIQAVMLYQSKVLKSEQHMTVGANGEIVHKSRDAFKKELAQQSFDNQTIARFKQDDI